MHSILVVVFWGEYPMHEATHGVKLMLDKFLDQAKAYSPDHLVTANDVRAMVARSLLFKSSDDSKSVRLFGGSPVRLSGGPDSGPVTAFAEGLSARFYEGWQSSGGNGGPA